MKRFRLVVFAAVLCVLGLATVSLVRGQAPDAETPPAPESAAAPAGVAAPGGGSAPGEAAAAEPPPAMMENPLGPIPPDDPKNEAYAHGRYLIALVNTLFSLVVLCAIVASGFGAWLQVVAEKLTRRANLKVAIYVVLFTLVNFVISLPLEIWSGYLHEKKFGFMNQGFGGWFGDQAKLLAVSLVLQALFFPLLYLVIRRLGRGWWVPGAALAIGFLIVVQAIAPVYIAPLFNTFTPLKDAALRKEILDLAHSQGIPADEVYQVDASRQSEHSNAYFAGLLGTQRVVLYDTILKRYTPREIRFVMGHEMGHYVLNHIWKTVGFVSVLIVAGFLIVDGMARRLIAAKPWWGIRRFEEPASLPLLLLLLSLFSLVFQPVSATYSRWQEHAADRFGLELLRDPEAAASVFLKFGKYDLSEYEVNPVIEFVLFSHPSDGNRIRYAQEWARQNGVAPAAPGAAAPAGAPPGSQAPPPAGS